MYKVVTQFSVVAVVLAMLLGACSDDGGDMTRTEQLRAELSEEVQRYMLEAHSAYESGSYLAALALTDSAEARVPELADIHFLRGRIYSDMSRFDLADSAYATALELDPEYPGASMNRGINLVQQGALRDAVDAFQREEAINPNSALYLEMGRTFARLSLPDSARMAYERAVELDSTNATALMWLGQLHEELGEFDQALEYSRRGARLRPENMDYKYIIGSQLFRTGQVEEAIEYLEPVAEARPWHHGAQYNMGQALMRMGQEDAAQVYLAQADSAQQLQQEINEAKDAMQRDPEDIENWVRLGEAHRNAGMYQEAVDAFRNAVAMRPQNLDLHTNLATVMLESGDTEAAVARYEAIIARDSTRVNAWLNLGVAHGNSGDYDEARAAWERVLELNPGDRRAQAYLAQLGRLAGE